MQWLKKVDDDAKVGGADDLTAISLDGERFVVVMAAGGQSRRLESATVARKDGTYVNKLTVHRVHHVDAGVYVCLSTNHAGYSFRRVHFAVIPREYSTLAPRVRPQALWRF